LLTAKIKIGELLGWAPGEALDHKICAERGLLEERIVVKNGGTEVRCPPPRAHYHPRC